MHAAAVKPAMAPAEPLQPGAFLVLRGADGLAAERRASCSVVLLHGWLQNGRAWLETGRRLRDKHGCDVLLVDFYRHGASQCIGTPSIEALVDQVRACIEKVGWTSRRIAVAGCSLGASVALRYADRFPSSVHGLLLVVPSGLPESWLCPANWVAALARRLPETLPPPLDKLLFVRTTPEYGVPPSVFKRLKDWHVTIITGKLDFIHTPHVAFWTAAAPHATHRRLLRDHTTICLNLAGLNLEEDPMFRAPPRVALTGGEQPSLTPASKL